MKKLFLKIVLLCSLIILSIMIIIGVAPKDKNNYLMKIIDIHKTLNITKSPRLILVGGSNLAFGIDSNRIQESIHMPVINTGLHAGMGLKFMIEDLKPYIREGDVIVIVPEYEHFYDNSLNGDDGGSLTYMVLKSVPREITYIDNSQIKFVLKGIPSILRQDLSNEIKYILGKSYLTSSDVIYRRDGFNDKGDVVTHLNMKPISISGKILNENSKYNKETITYLNEFKDFSNKKNAVVYFDFPCIPGGMYTTNKINYTYEQIKSKLSFNIIGSPDEYVFPSSYFFDTLYHLNAAGRQIRTEKLINDLRNVKELNSK